MGYMYFIGLGIGFFTGVIFSYAIMIIKGKEDKW
jgi:hypothetical protein